MRKLLLGSLLCWLSLTAWGQTYENDWIDFSKQYFRIKVSKQGLYRINYNTLNSAFWESGNSLNNVDPRNLQILYNGVEQYIYVRGEDDGKFHSSDFIEFYGEPLDGKFDSELFGRDLVWKPLCGSIVLKNRSSRSHTSAPKP